MSHPNRFSLKHSSLFTHDTFQIFRVEMYCHLLNDESLFFTSITGKIKWTINIRFLEVVLVHAIQNSGNHQRRNTDTVEFLGLAIATGRIIRAQWRKKWMWNLLRVDLSHGEVQTIPETKRQNSEYNTAYTSPPSQGPTKTTTWSCKVSAICIHWHFLGEFPEWPEITDSGTVLKSKTKAPVRERATGQIVTSKANCYLYTKHSFPLHGQVPQDI